MKGNLGASYTELSQFCSEVLGFEASRGMLCRIIARVTQVLETPYQELEAQLVKTWESLFRFVEEPTLYQPTNNLAEQTIRAVVRIRNNTQGTRSEWERIWNSRIFSVLATCKKQRRSSFHFILEAIKAHKFTGIYPSLLPT